MSNKRAIVFICLGLCVLSAGATLLGNPSISRTITEALIYVVIVVGLSIFVANTGILSFGHTSFMLLGAYGHVEQEYRRKPGS